MQGDRKCVIDHKRYVYCPNCGRGKAEDTWRYMFCSEGCRDIYHAIEDWATKKITPKSAKEILDRNNVLAIKDLRKDIFNSVQIIYASAKTEDEPVVAQVEEEVPQPKKKKTGRPKKVKKEIVNEN